MKKFLLCTAACLFYLGVARAQNPLATPANPSQARVGVLLLAHGGSATEWNEEVRHVADQVDLAQPTEVAFGMATRSSMQAAVNRLVARKVTEIVAVPLFVSSHSSVIDSISYLLGLRSQQPEDLKMFAAMDHGNGGMTMDHAAMTPDAAMTSEADLLSCADPHGIRARSPSHRGRHPARQSGIHWPRSRP